MKTDLLTDDFIGVIGAIGGCIFKGFGVSISGISAICGCILRELVFQIRQCASTIRCLYGQCILYLSV